MRGHCQEKILHRRGALKLAQEVARMQENSFFEAYTKPWQGGIGAQARMAKSADAADLKSADRKVVGVQFPLRAPIKSNTCREIGRRAQVAIFVWWLFWWLVVLTVWSPAILAASGGRFSPFVRQRIQLGERAAGGCVAVGYGNRLVRGASCVSLGAVWPSSAKGKRS